MKRRESERCTPEAVGIPSAALIKLPDALEYGGFNALFDSLLPAVSSPAQTLPKSETTHLLQKRLEKLALPRPTAHAFNRSESPLDMTLVPEGPAMSFPMVFGMPQGLQAFPGAGWVAAGQMGVPQPCAFRYRIY